MDTTRAVAEDLLVNISRHLPADHVWFGTPTVATVDAILTADGGASAVYVLTDGGCEAYRVYTMADGWAEVTRWAYGDELSRRIVSRGGHARPGA